MRKLLLLCLSVLLLLSLTPSAMALSDIDRHPYGDQIRKLAEAGVVQGENDGKFNPQGQLTYASGITMLVRGMDLSLARFLFLKQPEAKDYFTRVQDGMWYSEAFVIAQVNGLDIPKDVDPNQSMTREQFAHHLFRAIEATGEYAYILPYIMIDDEKDIAEEYMGSIQTLLVSNIIELGQDNRFAPKAEITRGEAAGWLHSAREFVRSMAEMPAPLPEPEPSPLTDVKLEVNPVNDEVNEVTITAQVPHPGYGLRISSISFIDGEAIIYPDVVWPDPERMYPQVISEVKVKTYVSSEFTPILPEEYQPGQNPGAGAGVDSSTGIYPE